MVVATRGGARAGAGRKRTIEDRVRVQVVVDARTRERAEIHAEGSVAEFVRGAIEELLADLRQGPVEVAGLGSGRSNLAVYPPAALAEACRAQVGPGTPFRGLSEFVRTAVARKAARA